MSANEIISNIIIGIVSGLISGKHYRKKDKKEEWLKQLDDDKRTMARYIEEVVNEIDEFNKGQEYDLLYLKRLMGKRPQFRSFNKEKIKPEFHEVTPRLYKILNELEDYLEGTIDKKKINQYKIELRRSKFEIVTINSDKPNQEFSK